MKVQLALVIRSRTANPFVFKRQMMAGSTLNDVTPQSNYARQVERRNNRERQEAGKTNWLVRNGTSNFRIGHYQSSLKNGTAGIHLINVSKLNWLNKSTKNREEVSKILHFFINLGIKWQKGKWMVIIGRTHILIAIHLCLTTQLIC